MLWVDLFLLVMVILLLVFPSLAQKAHDGVIKVGRFVKEKSKL